MSDFSSSLHFKVAKWGNAQPAMRVTPMAEEVQLCQTRAPNCWLGYSGKKKPTNPLTNNAFLCLKMDITSFSTLILL